jgi:ELWxxDGT repeat protein
MPDSATGPGPAAPAAKGRGWRALVALSALFAWSLAPAAPAARCQTAYLVRDLAPGDSATPNLYPAQFFSLGDRAVFIANDPVEPSLRSQSLWVSDGTPGGTQPLVAASSSPDSIYLGSARGVVFFVDQNGQLFRSDGTVAGSFQLTSNLSHGPTLKSRDFVFLRGILYFMGCSATCVELWRSDGTVAGTTMVAELQTPGSLEFGEAGNLTVAGGRLYFLNARVAGEIPAVWTSDGTPTGTVPVAALAAHFASSLFAVGDRLFGLGGPRSSDGFPTELWAADALGANPQVLLQLPDVIGFQGFQAAVAGGRLLFLADDGNGNQLWSSDGTIAGTTKLTQFPGPTTFDLGRGVSQLGSRLVFAAGIANGPRQLWAVSGSPDTVTSLTNPAIGDVGTIVAGGSRVVFSARTSLAAPVTVWSTDGTAGGTVPLKQTCDTQCSNSFLSPHLFLARVGGQTFFGVVEAAGFEIWSTDGTPAHTHRFGNGLMSFRTQRADDVALLGGKLLYTGGGGGGDGQLWISDGTAAGTRQLTDQPPSPLASSPWGFAALGDQVFFVTRAPAGGASRLWRSAGTADTTVQLAASVDSFPVVAGGSAFFLQQDAARTEQLWAADPSGSAIRQLTSFPAGQQIEANLVAYHGELLFAVAGASGCSIWRSDGTAAGTIQTIDLSGQAQHVTRLAALEPDLYFTTYLTSGIGTPDAAVWRSDGTPAGTTVLVDFADFIPDRPRFTRAGQLVFFIGETADGSSLALWRTDGTVAGSSALTRVGSVPDLVALDGLVYFFDRDSLMRSDGTAAGTFEAVRLSEPIADVPQSPGGLTAFNGRLFFAAGDPGHGFELWASDGSVAGTTLVHDINPGPAGSMLSPTALTVAGQRLYFAAIEPQHGVELWESDGTPAGTRLVQDIQPGPASSFPTGMTPAGGLLYFAADDGLSGAELWALPLTGGAGCNGSGSALCLLGNRFKVEAVWRDFQGNSGAAQAVPLSADTGYFWFFSPGNVEVIVKVLDGRALNGDFWVFFGALSSVEYSITVTDTQTGLTRRYVNPAGQLASTGDVRAFQAEGAQPAAPPQLRRGAGPPGAAQRSMPIPAPTPPSGPHPSQGRAATGPCHAGPGRLCLSGGRFAVEATWKDFAGHSGTGTAVPLTSDTGSFWFFDAANVEVVLKVLDGRAVNGKFWVFYGALSDVQYTLTVTDTLTGAVRTYVNPSGQFASVGDTGAF